MSRPSSQPESGIVLPAGHTGSTLFHAILLEAARAFPDVLGTAALPEQPAVFKRDYGEHLARFEAARVASPQRSEIARFLLERTQAQLRFADANGHVSPLAEALLGPAPAIELTRSTFGSEPSLRAEVPFEGRRYRGREVIELAERLAAEHQMTSAALAALRWSVERIEADGGVLDLRGHCFAQLGAAAELATTRLLLSGGATVLWVDLAEPQAALRANPPSAGTVLHAAGASNLLQGPAAIRAAIARCYDEAGPLHLGMFAYASGASREWRLGAAMNAVALQLPPESLRSISLLVSPTTAATWQPESVRSAQLQLSAAAGWKTALQRAGLLSTPGHFSGDGVQIGRSTVSIQGLSYQAAQYLSKLAAAETFAVYGTDLQRATAHPLTVSANVAGITRTRSLQHPLFQAAFIGAPRFGVRIFDPAATRALSGLLILHDLLNPAAPGASGSFAGDAAGKARALFSQQVHGGIYALPYALEHAIRVAAVIGMGSRPSLLLGRKPREQSVAPAE